MTESTENLWDLPPDPRIKWALDLMDEEAKRPPTLIGHYIMPVLGGLSGYFSRRFRNVGYRRPLYAGLPMTILTIASGFYIGVLVRDFIYAKQNKEMAILRHYLMLHPDRFPEPETKKFGDKCVLFDWPTAR